MRLYIFLFVLFSFGCKSLERQRYQANKYFDRYPSELAIKCESKFPVIDSLVAVDSTGIIESNNENYRAEIDSLLLAVQIADHNIVLGKKKVDSISDECADVVISYMKDLDLLNRKIKELSNKYKPCDPDTLSLLRTIYRRSTAHEYILNDSIQQYKYQLGVITDQYNQQELEIDKKDSEIIILKDEKKQWMWRAIGTWIGMAIFLGGALFMYIKK